MKIHQLRALVAVSAQGSINGAAKALHVTQPAITKAIRELENEFGVQLLERNQWGVIPTPEGATLLDRARTVVREIERAQEDMSHLKGAREGKLAIGVTPIVGTAGLAEAYIAFRKRWPRVSVEFRELGFHQMSEQLRNRTLDLAFSAFTKPLTETGGVEELFTLDTVFVTRATSRFANARSLDALREAEWIHTDVTEGYPTFIREMFTRAGVVPPDQITRCTSFALFYSLTINTDSVFGWTWHSLRETELGRTFVPLQLPVTPLPLRLYLLTPPELQLTRPARDFLDAILEHRAMTTHNPTRVLA
ncbi:LysR family transcriptional regulator [Pararobbsia silviterrae]|uniref:LysR family transcriptional regulator n=1 Tax=Pararobbsia silviterrae TaxID=1792498 RepID=A0A494XHN7_9BURK|nr:LysR family transcriptional regulator [Pararobbsia silviterrae]RKP47053.1 LysR family transcriptional regulator [Pararobbsia silviterrae]